MSETSDMKFLNTCRRQLDIYKVDPRWNHSSPKLKITTLEAKLASGYPIAEAVKQKVPPYQIKINNRQAAYAKVDPMVRASRRYLKSTEATDAEVADANTAYKKVLKPSGKKKETLDPNQPAVAVEKTNSTSHRSYDSQAGNLIAVREMLTNISAYTPNEDGIKVADFDAVIAECQTANAEVSAAFIEPFAAWNERDAKLYNDADSILEDFRNAKEYYKSLYEPGTPQYQMITAPDMLLTNNSRSYK